MLSLRSQIDLCPSNFFLINMKTDMFKVIPIIIQHIVTLPKYGHGELKIRHPHIRGILRYTSFSCFGEKNGRALSKSNDLARTPNY